MFGGLRRARQGQRVLHRMAHRLVQLAGVAKTHLDLGRMDVHVDAVRRDVDEQQVGRLARAMQHVFEGGARAVGDELVAHEAAVDVDVLLVGARARRIRQADAAFESHAAVGGVQGAARVDEFVAQHVAHPLVEPRVLPVSGQLAVVPDRKADVGARQRLAAHGLQAVRELGRVGLEELAACRGAEEQLAHFDAGAHRACRGREFAGARVDALGMRRVDRATGDGHVGDRRDGRQRLAAKAHRRHILQLLERGDLAGGVAPQRQRKLGRGDAGAVVFKHDAAHAARGQPQHHLRGASVERVVEQLAHHRGGPLDHLTGSDLADELVGQLADRPARCGAARGKGRGGHGGRL